MITIKQTTTTAAGSCSACMNRDKPVADIELLMTSIRLCPDCWSALKQEMEKLPAFTSAKPSLADQYGGVWGEHPDYPRADWQYEVSNGDTNQSYWDWVEHEIEMKDLDKHER